MAIQEIIIGNYANDGTGDDLRTAFQKVNANFASLTTSINIATASNVGTGVGVFKAKTVADLEFKSLTSTDGSITFTPLTNEINLKANTTVEDDTAPLLGGDLGLNGHRIYGPGDVQAPIYGVSVPLLESIVALLINSNSVTIDLGEFLAPSGVSPSLPSGYILDLGSFLIPAAGNHLDFGTF